MIQSPMMKVEKGICESGQTLAANNVSERAHQRQQSKYSSSRLQQVHGHFRGSQTLSRQ